MMALLLLLLVPAEASSFSASASHRDRDAAASSASEECEDLAALFTKNYYNASTPFEGSTEKDLSAYLAHHGVLLSMCLEVGYGVCMPPQGGHASASWISNATGPAIFDTTRAHTGVILDPLSVDVLCAYPMDGASNSRDGVGCGPQKLDRDYGSRGNASISPEGREAEKKAYDAKLERQVGPGKTWKDVKCSEWYGQYKLLFLNFTSISPSDRSIEACERFKESGLQGQVVYRPFLSKENEDHAAILGHPLCVDDLIPCTERDCSSMSYVVFDASCSWAPREFQAMVDMQVEIRDQVARPHRLELWNELVLNATGFRDANKSIQAVFWVESPKMSAAQIRRVQGGAVAQSVKHGGKPILRFDLTMPERPSFSCWRSRQ